MNNEFTLILCSECYDDSAAIEFTGVNPRSICERCGRLCLGYSVDRQLLAMQEAGLPDPKTSKATEPGGTGGREKCQKRLPDIKRDGWTYSLLCDLPKDHEGGCEPDDLEILAGKIVPELEKKYPIPLVG